MKNKKSESVSNLNRKNSTMDGQTIYDDRDVTIKPSDKTKGTMDNQTIYD